MKQNMKVPFFVPYTIPSKFLKYQEKSHTIIVYGKGTCGSPMTPPFPVSRSSTNKREGS